MMLQPNEPQPTPEWVLPERGLTYPAHYAGDDELTIPPNIELGQE